jgi:hypothetical protein
MSTHTATIRWQNTGPAFLKRHYSREHTIHFDGGVIVPGSPSPHIVPAPWSSAAAVDPEEAFVASWRAVICSGFCMSRLMRVLNLQAQKQFSL